MADIYGMKRTRSFKQILQLLNFDAKGILSQSRAMFGRELHT